MAPAISQEIGYPVIESFEQRVEAWGGEPQNFGVAVDRGGYVYLANLGGLAIFDGAHATLVKIGKQTTAFDVAVDPQGRVAVGGAGDFGWIDSDGEGRPVFRSLTRPEIDPADLNQVQAAVATDGFVFMGRNQLFHWDGKELTSVARFSTGRPFPRAFSIAGVVYVWDQVAGLRRLAERRLVPLPGGAQFVGRRVDALAGAPDGLLVSVRGEGFFRLVGERATPFAPQATQWALAARVLESMQLADGRWALGSLLGGLLLLRQDGSIERVIDTKSGLVEDFVSGLATDAEGSLWVAMNHGLLRLEIGSPVSIFDERSGLPGSVLAVHRHRGHLWVGTSAGVFTTDGANAATQFRSLPEMRGGGWSFASVGQELLAAPAFGVAVVSPGPVREVAGLDDWTAYTLAPSSTDPARVWVGLSLGLGAVRRSAAGWILEGRIAHFEQEIRSILETADGTVWCSGAAGGLHRIEFTGGDLTTARVTSFPDPEERTVVLTRVGGKIVGVREEQVLVLDQATGRFEESPLLRLESSATRMVEDAAGGLWLNTTPPTRVVRGTGGVDAISSLASLPSRSIEVIHAEPDGVVWFGSDKGLIRLAGGGGGAVPPLPRPRVSRLLSDSQRLLFGGSPRAEPGSASLGAAIRRLRVDFGPLSFRSGLRYQTRLEPIDEEWGPWSPDPHVDFTRLPAGRYTLRFRTGGPSGEVSEPTTWSFTVLPPWYRSPWALGLWLLAVLAAVRGYGEVRVRAANARAARLERIVAEQTAELKSANQRLLDLSTRDELTGLANRRLFDERLAEEWARARRQGTPLALILADLDHFKRLNDSLGHPAGDACLRAVARSFRDTLRRSLDLVARYGGEEFALLLSDTAAASALEVAEELRQGVESLGIAADAEGATRVTASFGVAVVQPGEDNQPQTLIEAADQALYRAKRGGRNQVVGDSI